MMYLCECGFPVFNLLKAFLPQLNICPLWPWWESVFFVFIIFHPVIQFTVTAALSFVVSAVFWKSSLKDPYCSLN